MRRRAALLAGGAMLALVLGGCSAEEAEESQLGYVCQPRIPGSEVRQLSRIDFDRADHDLCDPNVRADLIADDTYLDAVHAVDVPFTDDVVALKVGLGMCELIERAVLNGYSVPDAKVRLMRESERAAVYSTRENRTIINAAVASYCPEYETR